MILLSDRIGGEVFLGRSSVILLKTAVERLERAEPAVERGTDHIRLFVLLHGGDKAADPQPRHVFVQTEFEKAVEHAGKVILAVPEL